jgi:hypothetical protein
MEDIDTLRDELKRSEATLRFLKLKRAQIAEKASLAAAKAEWRLHKHIGRRLLDRIDDPRVQSLLRDIQKELPVKSADMLAAALCTRQNDAGES